MTLALPGRTAAEFPELALAFEETVMLLSGRAWLDVRCDGGEWYASLRTRRSTDVAGVNGFCDCWRGPYHTREAAVTNGYLFGRQSAIGHGCRIAPTLPTHLPTGF